jgi:hypothetical protein
MAVKVDRAVSAATATAVSTATAEQAEQAVLAVSAAVPLWIGLSLRSTVGLAATAAWAALRVGRVLVALVELARLVGRAVEAAPAEMARP